MHGCIIIYSADSKVKINIKYIKFINEEVKFFIVEVYMSGIAFNQFVNKIDMLSYSQRMTLLQKLVSSFSKDDEPKKIKKMEGCNDAFGIWSDRDISLESIRAKAWNRS